MPQKDVLSSLLCPGFVLVLAETLKPDHFFCGGEKQWL